MSHCEKLPLLKLAVVVAFFALTATVRAEGDGVDESLSRTLRATAGQPLRIMFNTLYRSVFTQPFTVTIESFPERGKFIERRTGVAITNNRRTADRNEFLYVTSPGLNGTFTFNVSLDFPTGPQKRATITVRVRSSRLYARTLTFITYPGRSRDIQLEVRSSRSSLQKLTVDPSTQRATEPKYVEVITLPAKCSLSQWDGTAITATPTKILDSELRLKVQPQPGLVSGDRCSFYYRAMSGAEQASNDAPVIVKVADERAPYAFSARIVYRLGVDTSRPISLKASPPVANEEISFYLLSVPKVGKLYLVNDTQEFGLGTPLKVDDPTSGTLIHKSRRDYRAVLFYSINTTKVGSISPGAVTFTFKAVSKRGSSPVVTNTITLVKTTAPLCGITIYSPVFWDKPVNRIHLNYTDPTGAGVDRVVLSQVPKNPIGRLYFRRRTIDDAATKLRGGIDQTVVNSSKPGPLLVGRAFNDRKDGIYYKVLASNKNRRGNESFYFRVFNKAGESCRGVLVFDVKPHDGKEQTASEYDAQTGSTRQVNVAIRRETAKAGAFTLLPLWGTANKTVYPYQAVITKLPQIGSIYLLKTNAPYEEGRMYRQSLSTESYCRRYNCNKYLGKRLAVGDVVPRISYGNDTSISRPRLFVLYRAPLVKLDPSRSDASIYTVKRVAPDTFEYRFESQTGQRSGPQRVEVYVRRGRLPVITVKYAKKEAWDWTAYNSQRLKAIRVRILNETELGKKVVMVLKEDLFRRHGKLARFQLFDFEQDGARVVPTKELKPVVRNGIEGSWVGPSGTVALVPGINSRKQVYTFRARIFTLGPNGDFDPSAFQDFRVNVVRENTVPVFYPTRSDSAITAFTDTVAFINLAAGDFDGDTLQFKVTRGPKYGTLTLRVNHFLKGFEIPAREGSLLGLPRGTAHTGTVGDVELQLVYRSKGRADLRYPLNDSIAIVADDGGEINSEPWRVAITVLRSPSFMTSSASRTTSTQSATIAAVVAMVIAGGALFVIIQRRRAKARYMQLPRAGETELGAVKVSAPKVASPTS